MPIPAFAAAGDRPALSRASLPTVSFGATFALRGSPPRPVRPRVVLAPPPAACPNTSTNGYISGAVPVFADACGPAAESEAHSKRICSRGYGVLATGAFLWRVHRQSSRRPGRVSSRVGVTRGFGRGWLCRSPSTRGRLLRQRTIPPLKRRTVSLPRRTRSWRWRSCWPVGAMQRQRLMPSMPS